MTSDRIIQRRVDESRLELFRTRGMTSNLEMRDGSGVIRQNHSICAARLNELYSLPVLRPFDLAGGRRPFIMPPIRGALRPTFSDISMEQKLNYLVTGGAGFIGSHLCEALLQQGHEVVALDDLSTGRYENIAGLESNPGFSLIVESDTRVETLDPLVRKADGVFHLASAVGVRLIIDKPVYTVRSMIRGVDAVLGHCARYRKPLLITSSSEVYGKSENVPFSEDDDRLMGPTTMRRWSYASAKAVGEFLALAYWHESRLPVVVARLFNVVGPRQTGQYGMVVPRFARQGLKGEPITVFGDGKQTRCFAHVKDTVGALAQLIEHPGAPGRVFNVGNDEEITILDLAEKVRSKTGNRSEIRMIPYSEAYVSGFEDMRRRVPDLSKLRALIEFKPQYDLDAILDDVIRHERAAMKGSGCGKSEGD